LIQPVPGIINGKKVIVKVKALNVQFSAFLLAFGFWQMAFSFDKRFLNLPYRLFYEKHIRQF